MNKEYLWGKIWRFIECLYMIYFKKKKENSHEIKKCVLWYGYTHVV